MGTDQNHNDDDNESQDFDFDDFGEDDQDKIATKKVEESERSKRNNSN